MQSTQQSGICLSDQRTRILTHIHHHLKTEDLHHIRPVFPGKVLSLSCCQKCTKAASCKATSYKAAHCCTAGCFPICSGTHRTSCQDRIVSRIIRHDLFYIILGFFIWWDASVFGHTVRTCVISCQCKAYVSSEPVQILF